MKSKKIKPKELVNLEKFFFFKKFTKNGKPLFESQVQMAEIFIGDETNPWYGKNIYTTRSAVSQLFSGERNISRNLSQALRCVIIFETKNRKINPKKVLEEFELLVQRLKPVWKIWSAERKGSLLNLRREREALLEKVKYSYDPNMDINSEDLQYLLTVLNGSNKKVSLGILMELLKKRKAIAGE